MSSKAFEMTLVSELSEYTRRVHKSAEKPEAVGRLQIRGKTGEVGAELARGKIAGRHAAIISPLPFWTRH